MATILKEQVCEQFGQGECEFQQPSGCWEEEEEEERLSKVHLPGAQQWAWKPPQNSQLKILVYI